MLMKKPLIACGKITVCTHYDLIRSYFIEYDPGRTVFVYIQRYGLRINNFFLPKIEDYKADGVWFEHEAVI